MFSSVDIHYQTVALPPPYAYRYFLKMFPEGNALRVRLDWRYTDREELTSEEVEEEGFSMSDDFFWEGTLPEVWKSPLNDLLRSTQWLSNTAPDDTSLRVTVNDSDEQVTVGSPRNPETWEYFLQEVVQAVYEAAQREQPLRIAYLALRKGSEPVEIHWKASFLLREFTQTQRLGDRQAKKQLPWSQLRSLLQVWYVPDYHPEKAEKSTPRQKGQYIDPGDGNWYQLGKAVTNPGKPDAIGQLQTAVQRLSNDGK